MVSRLIVPLVCAAALVFACGPRTRTGARPSNRPSAGDSALRSASADPARPRRRGASDTGLVGATLDVVAEPGGVRLALAVTNRGRRGVELDFPDGHTRDFAVLDESGREVWRWGRGRLFTQTVQTRFVSGGDTVTYGERWTPPRAGTYTAVAELRSGNYPVQQRLTFTVRPAGSGAPTVAAVEREGSPATP